MGNKNAQILIWSFVGLLVFAVFALIFWLNSLQSWMPNYEPVKDEAYGSIVFQRYAKKKTDSREENYFELIDSLSQDAILESKSGGSYVFIGEKAYQDSTEAQLLLDFVAKGNQAWLLCEDFSWDFMMQLFFSELYAAERDEKWENYRLRMERIEKSENGEKEREDEELEIHEYDEFEGFEGLEDFQLPQIGDSNHIGPNDPYEHWSDIGEFIRYRADTSIQFISKPGSTDQLELEFAYMRQHEVDFYPWISFELSTLNHSPQEFEVLGEHRHGPFLIRVPHGDGEVFLHSVPLMACNYPLLRKDVFEFTKSYTQDMEGSFLVWDDYSREGRWIKDPTSGGQVRSSGNRPQIEDGPLSFIFSQPPLKAAWFVLMGLALLYLILGARRKQRAIPVFTPPNNTSVEYAETIGHMFRQKNEHHRLMKMQGELFKSFVRDRYSIQLKKDEKMDETLHLLAQKSDYSLDILKEIQFLSTKAKENQQGSEASLVRLHQLLEDFYANCK